MLQIQSSSTEDQRTWLPATSADTCEGIHDAGILIGAHFRRLEASLTSRTLVPLQSTDMSWGSRRQAAEREKIAPRGVPCVRRPASGMLLLRGVSLDCRVLPYIHSTIVSIVSPVGSISMEMGDGAPAICSARRALFQRTETARGLCVWRLDGAWLGQVATYHAPGCSH